MDQKQFGIYFAELREKSGYRSQRQLSIASGISNGTIARIEAGTQKPQPETLKVLAQYLRGITYEELLERAGYIDSGTHKENEDIESEWPEGIKVLRRANEKLSPAKKKQMLKIIQALIDEDEEDEA
ncbi:helix-turn-helix transcriptional regulator [Aneurinibacillus thermoaerophilus]|jgi:transcriptional regulator with XRE-family HTH domain|uniref:helix-turn-helix domain-containing protein n=1 Tax=Aneurinibacillus thermoaerophilus TaxID=143495 RepID=UPI0019811794|nr:helix-turn-helix transcriptional regulator [Aneurinibacillus thermoaerophilus]MBN6186359.1 helix-turn-helix transcriptional regulator [Aneurinibacillus sp. BA2021]MED0759020.1 helix-turn-helix transcriptional regulator [Aneurinibacillus thermoaerophilus]MED0762326.1 helix-turn-helix transcriptional regulator [Aneurinibacillus thermoaerophilus]